MKSLKVLACAACLLGTVSGVAHCRNREVCTRDFLLQRWPRDSLRC